MKWSGVSHPTRMYVAWTCRCLAHLIHNYEFAACKVQCLAHSRPLNVYWTNGHIELSTTVNLLYHTTFLISGSQSVVSKPDSSGSPGNLLKKAKFQNSPQTYQLRGSEGEGPAACMLTVLQGTLICTQAGRLSLIALGGITLQ